MPACNHLDSIIIDRSIFYCSDDQVTKDGFEINEDVLRKSLIPFCSVHSVTKLGSAVKNEKGDALEAVLHDAPAMMRYDIMDKVPEIDGYQRIDSMNIIRIAGKEKVAAIMPALYANSIYDVAPSISIIMQLLLIIDTLHKSGVMHGSINHDTVRYDKGADKVMLSDCVLSSCGSMQRREYEYGGRALSHPFGKNDQDFTADYYALGILILTWMLGDKFNEFAKAEIASRDLSIDRKVRYLISLCKSREYRGSQFINIVSVLLSRDINDCRELRNRMMNGKSIKFKQINILKQIIFDEEGGGYSSMSEFAHFFASGAFMSAKGAAMNVKELISFIMKFSSKGHEFLYNRMKSTILTMQSLLRDFKLDEDFAMSICAFMILKEEGDDNERYLIWNKGGISYHIKSLRSMLAYANASGDLNLIAHFSYIFSFAQQKIFKRCFDELCLYQYSDKDERDGVQFPYEHLTGYEDDQENSEERRNLFQYIVYTVCSNMPYSAEVTNYRLCFTANDVVKFIGEKAEIFAREMEDLKFNQELEDDSVRDEIYQSLFDCVPVTYYLYDFLLVRLGMFAWPDVRLVSQIRALKRDRWVILLYLFASLKCDDKCEKVLTKHLAYKISSSVIGCFMGETNKEHVLKLAEAAKDKGKFAAIMKFLQDKRLQGDKEQYASAFVKFQALKEDVQAARGVLENVRAIKKRCTAFYTIGLSFVFILYILTVVFSI